MPPTDAPRTTPDRPANGAAPATMRAVTQEAYGSADVLRLDRIAVPSPGEGDVLVRIDAAGVDRGTAHLMRGTPYLIRALGFGLRAPRQPVPGLDLSGTVVAVGPGVTPVRRRRRGVRDRPRDARRVRASPARTSSPRHRQGSSRPRPR